MISEPKKDIYDILSAIEGVTVYQRMADIEVNIPCMIFSISGNTPEYVLAKEVGYQDIEVDIDIYAKNSSESGSLLITLESEMLSNDYRMISCLDVPDENYSHITTKFNLVG